MAIGGKLLCGVAVLSVAACANQQGELTIRAASSPLAAESRPVPARIAEARAQLLLGKVGLAVESFRIAARDDPSSSEALAGLAECYDRMRRFDLSRRYYEAALAIAPADVGLLERLAVSLERQRKPDDAAEVRREIAMRRGQTATPSAAEPAAVALASTEIAAPAQTVTVPLAPAPLAEPAVIATFVAIAPEQERPALASMRAEPEPVAVAAAIPARVTVTAAARPANPVAAAPASAVAPAPVAAPPAAAPVKAEPDQLARLSAPTTDPRPLPEQPRSAAAAPAPAASVTVALPPARPPGAQAKVEPSPSNRPSARPQLARGGGEPPRLERLSMAEVALVSNDKPLWRPQVVAQTSSSTTIRFVPLKQHSQATASVRLLNAARSHRLAAHTRDYLSGMGWRRIAIGDADEVRETSIIYYPESRRRTAEILAAQFRIRVLRRAGEDSAIVMLLGRDAARTRSRRTSA